MLNAATGANRHGGGGWGGTTPRKNPFGHLPRLLRRHEELGVRREVSGGYFDPAALTLWSGPNQQVVGMGLATGTGSTPLTENSTLALEINLGAGEKGFSQASVIGTQLFFSSDSTDINQATFGTTAVDTGRLYSVDLATGSSTAVIIAAGAGSVARNETTVFAASGRRVERILVVEESATAASTNIPLKAKLARKLWLRSL